MNKQSLLFIKNTSRILDQYRIAVKNGCIDPNLAHTLFINACVGLLIVPQQSIFDGLPNTPIDENDWGLMPDNIVNIKNDDKSVRNVALMIRHSIAHYNFHFEYNEELSIPIKTISFENWKNEFTATFDFEDFKKFVLKVADEAVKYMQREIDN